MGNQHEQCVLRDLNSIAATAFPWEPSPIKQLFLLTTVTWSWAPVSLYGWTVLNTPCSPTDVIASNEVLRDAPRMDCACIPLFSHGYRDLLTICIPGCEGPPLLPLPKRLGQGLEAGVSQAQGVGAGMR